MSVGSHRRWSTAVLAASLCVIAAANYLVWLGWDQRYDVGPAGTATGPYEAWQIAGVTLGLVGLAALAGRAQRPHVAIAVVPATTTLCFVGDAAPGSALWVIGGALVALGSLIGVTLVASLTSLLQSRRGPERST
jgi:TRAP-type C4-dicarboxylate transport system permease small subunit